MSWRSLKRPRSFNPPGKLFGCLALLALSLFAVACAEAPATEEAAADPYAKGRALFAEHCAECHSLQPGLVRVGPSLSDARGKAALRGSELAPEAYLLESILDPNAFVIGGFTEAMPEDLVSESEAQHIIDFIVADP